MRVEQRLPHEAHAAHQAFVRLLVAVYESVRVPVVSAVKRFATDLRGKDILIINVKRKSDRENVKNLVLGRRTSHWYGFSPV